jgi:phosphosulfolactate synthase
MTSAARCSSGLTSKTSFRTISPAPKAWVDAIHRDLEAGARWVILEGRESGTHGIYEASGQVRGELIKTILSSAISVDDLFFEAPRKDQQAYFIGSLGASVNLANISPNNAISLETLRRDLRSDTLIALSTET